MIIAAKKEISIPLQPMTSTTTTTSSTESTVSGFVTKETATTVAAAVDVVTIHSRPHPQNDFITQIFGQTSTYNQVVKETLSITTTHVIDNSRIRKLVCESFIHNHTVFLESPFVGNNRIGLNWADGEFQSCITHLIELAEEKTGCQALIVAMDRRLYKDALSTVLRAFMYLGFEMVPPHIYRHEPGYVLVGYDL